MANRFAVAIVACAALFAGHAVAHADATKSDAKFFGQLNGKWKGPGEIVAGKYKGTKFVCDLDGSTPQGSVGMVLDGNCRVGVFSQKMTATITQGGRSYKGQFLDGAAGEGLDVVAGNVSADRVVLSLKRKQLDGAMLARLADDNQMNVTISVRVAEELVPVIGMRLTRVDGTAVGSVN